MTKQEWDGLVAKARKTNLERDAQDEKRGFATPYQSIELLCGTVGSAIEAGAVTGDKNCLAEAFAMLEVFGRSKEAETFGLFFMLMSSKRER